MVKPAIVRFRLLVLLMISLPVSGANHPVGGDFSLTDHLNQPFHLSSAKGKVVILFFGYTYCPDICPTILSDIAQILNSLGKKADNVVPLFVSVDPERDSIDRLAEYVPWFHKSIIGLGGTPEQIRRITDAYHIQVKINKTSERDSNYSVDHSAGIYLIDQSGTLVQIIPYGLPLDHTIRAIKSYLKH